MKKRLSGSQLQGKIQVGLAVLAFPTASSSSPVTVACLPLDLTPCLLPQPAASLPSPPPLPTGPRDVAPWPRCPRGPPRSPSLRLGLVPLPTLFCLWFDLLHMGLPFLLCSILRNPLTSCALDFRGAFSPSPVLLPSHLPPSLSALLPSP